MNSQIEQIKAYIEKLKTEEYFTHDEYDGYVRNALDKITSFINSLPSKPQPKHSFFEHIYHCGRQPMWKVGDVLAIYEFSSDHEGEHVLGEVIDVRMNETNEDWIYTFKGGHGDYENDLISEQAYKKN